MVNYAIQATLVLAVLTVTVSAGPRYIAIPLDDFQVIALGERPRGLRLPRQTGWGETESRDQAGEGDGRVERQAHGHHDHVDYGAHTGHHGAFGWYADFPVTTHH